MHGIILGRLLHLHEVVVSGAVVQWGEVQGACSGSGRVSLLLLQLQTTALLHQFLQQGDSRTYEPRLDHLLLLLMMLLNVLPTEQKRLTTLACHPILCWIRYDSYTADSSEMRYIKFWRDFYVEWWREREKEVGQYRRELTDCRRLLSYADLYWGKKEKDCNMWIKTVSSCMGSQFHVIIIRENCEIQYIWLIVKWLYFVCLGCKRGNIIVQYNDFTMKRDRCN